MDGNQSFNASYPMGEEPDHVGRGGQGRGGGLRKTPRLMEFIIVERRSGGTGDWSYMGCWRGYG